MPHALGVRVVEVHGADTEQMMMIGAWARRALGVVVAVASVAGARDAAAQQTFSFAADAAGWTSAGGSNDWTWLAGAGENVGQGAMRVQGTNYGSYLLSSPTLVATADAPTVTLRHRYSIEWGWDGGYVGASVNGGAFGRLLATSSGQGYDGAIISAGYQPGFTGGRNWTTSTFTLANVVAGDAFQVGLGMTMDASVIYEGWTVGSVTVSNVPAVTATPEPATLALVGGGLALVGVAARRRRTA